MYIAYVYIIEFEGLRDIELCLSNRYKIKSAPRLKDDPFVIKISENPDYVPNFWSFPEEGEGKEIDSAGGAEQATIGQMSALVGMNGAGKTRIMYLLSLIAIGGRELGKWKFVALLEGQDGRRFREISDYDVKVQYQWSSSLEDLGRSVPDSFERHKIGEEFHTSSRSHEFPRPVYYSPNLGSSCPFPLVDSRISNVSEQMQLFRWVNAQKNRIDGSSISDFFTKSVISSIEDVTKAKGNSFLVGGNVGCLLTLFGGELEPPDPYPVVSPDLGTELVQIFDSYRSIFEDLKKFFYDSHRYFRCEVELREKPDIDLIWCHFILHFLLKILNHDGSSTRFSFFLNMPKRENRDMAEYLEAIREYMSSFPKTKSWMHSASLFVNWLRNEEVLIPVIQREDRRFQLMYFEFPLDKFAEFALTLRETRILNSDLVGRSEEWNSDRVHNDFDDFPFRVGVSKPLSSGQQTLLSCTARVVAGIRFWIADFNYCIVRRHPQSEQFARNFPKGWPVLLLLDEIETNLHPQYQVEFVYDFLKLVLPDIHPQMHLQIVFATHSPMILSDFPGYCVQRLPKPSNGQVRAADEHAGDLKTFGANVHTLLRNEFFLDSTIGKFAREKIKELIKELSNFAGSESEVLNDEKRAMLDDKVDDFLRRINLIGEPVLRQQLQNMLRMQLAFNVPGGKILMSKLPS